MREDLEKEVRKIDEKMDGGREEVTREEMR